MAKIEELFADTSSTMKMPITNPKSDDVICDKDGNESFLEFLPPDHPDVRKRETARSKQLKKMLMRGKRKQLEDADPLEERVDAVVDRLCGWHLVSPAGEIIDLKFSRDAAQDLLSKPQMGWLLRQATSYANTEADFTKPSSENSSNTPKGNSAEA